MATGRDRCFAAFEASKQHGDVGVSNGRAWGSVDEFKEEVNAAQVYVYGGGAELESGVSVSDEGCDDGEVCGVEGDACEGVEPFECVPGGEITGEGSGGEAI